MTWITTFTGRRVDLLDLQPDQISIDDIAHSLSMLCRFTGHVRQFYSVAQHSVLVARNLPPSLRLQGLLHDAHEAYVGDWSTPLKVSLSPAVRDELRAIEARLITCIGAALGVNLDHDPAVKQVDRMALRAEAELLVFEPIADADSLPFPTFSPFAPWMPSTAAEAFRREYRRLTPRVKCGVSR